MPVVLKYWQQHQVYDGTYDLDDLLNIHELIAVQNENQLRANQAQKEGGD